MALNYTKGTISAKSEVVGGISQSGREWKRQNIILDVPGYQGAITKLALQANGDTVDALAAFPIGAKVEVGWTIYAREWNGKYYNNVDIVNIKADGVAPAAPAAPAATAPAESESLEPQGGDLPF